MLPRIARIFTNIVSKKVSKVRAIQGGIISVMLIFN
jgi:hypothetical protein